MLLTPNMQVRKITDITIEMLKENNIKGMILDVDNTLIDLDRVPLEGIKEWIDNMKNEGIKFIFNSKPLRICNNNIECIKTETDENRGLKDIPNSNYSISTDYIVSAIGSGIDKNFIKDFDLELNEKGYVKVDENNMTSKNGIFACGDLIGTKATVAFACRSGRDSAENIVSFLNN